VPLPPPAAAAAASSAAFASALDAARIHPRAAAPHLSATAAVT
jgi:hypothetical protein